VARLEWAILDDGLAMAEANVLACAQAIHTIPDSLAHVLYYALGLNLEASKLEHREISVGSVTKRLPANSDPYSLVLRLLSEFKEGHFKALSDIVN